MKYWYVGTSDFKLISTPDWAQLGITSLPTAWSQSNLWGIDESLLSSGVKAYLDTASDFSKAATDPKGRTPSASNTVDPDRIYSLTKYIADQLYLSYDGLNGAIAASVTTERSRQDSLFFKNPTNSGTLGQVPVLQANGSTLWSSGVPGNDARLAKLDGYRQVRITDPDYPDQMGKDFILNFDDLGVKLGNVGIVTPESTTFSKSVTADQGFDYVIADNVGRAYQGHQRGIHRVWSNNPWLKSGDSMANVSVKDYDPTFSAQTNRKIIDQATSGDLAEWITARIGGKPARVVVNDGRQTGSVLAGTIPATGSCSITVYPQLGATARSYRAVIAGVSGVFTPIQNTGSPDPLAADDPGSIAYNYGIGTFTRDTDGYATIVPDYTPFQTGWDYTTGYEYRRGWHLIQPSRHNFFRRYQKITITATGGSFALAAGSQYTQPIAWSATDATLANNVKTALIALTGFTGVSVSVLSGLPGQTTAPGQLQINWASSDTPVPVVVVANMLTSGTIVVGNYHTGTNDTVSSVNAMLSSLTSDARAHSIVFDIGPFPGEEAGTTRRALFDDCCTSLRTAFGDMYMPIWALMRNPAVVTSVGATPFVAASGQTTTNDDAYGISMGMTPASLLDQTAGVTPGGSFAGGHPGPYGAIARSNLIQQYIASHGAYDWTEKG